MAALSEVRWGLRGEQIFAFARRDPGRLPTSRRPTPCGVSPFPKRRGGSVSGSPAGVRERPPHSGLQGHFPGELSGGRCGCRAWGRSLRTPTCRRGHRQYLHSGPPYDFPRYRSTVHEVTQAFAAASREVLAVEAELAGRRAQPLLAGHVRSLQQLEETRLATVRPRPPAAVLSSVTCVSNYGPLCAPWRRGQAPASQSHAPGAPDPTSILH